MSQKGSHIFFHSVHTSLTLAKSGLCRNEKILWKTISGSECSALSSSSVSESPSESDALLNVSAKVHLQLPDIPSFLIFLWASPFVVFPLLNLFFLLFSPVEPEYVLRCWATNYNMHIS